MMFQRRKSGYSRLVPFLFLLLSVFCLAACSGSTSETMLSGSSTAEAEEQDFEFPPETDKLVIYSDKVLGVQQKLAVERFQELYPDVDVEYCNFSQDEYFEKLRVEIPAGKGPDVVYELSTYLPDVYKTMASGVFIDLNPYFANDPDFCFEDYNQTVMDACMLQGKRYIVPIVYVAPILLTSQEILDENGISAEMLGTYDGFMDACQQYHQNHPDQDLLAIGANDQFLQQLYEQTGFKLINPDTNEIAVKQDQLKKLLDVCKSYYPGHDYLFIEEGSAEALFHRNILFSNMQASLGQHLLGACSVKLLGDTPVLFNCPNEDGGVSAEIYNYLAIPEGSPNKLNAYRYIKIFLSETIQYAGMENGNVNVQIMDGFPIQNLSFDKTMEKELESFDFAQKIADDFPIYTDRLRELVSEIDSVFIMRTEMYNSSKKYMFDYIQGRDDFEGAYRKLMNFLTIYRDE